MKTNWYAQLSPIDTIIYEDHAIDVESTKKAHLQESDAVSALDVKWG